MKHYLAIDVIDLDHGAIAEIGDYNVKIESIEPNCNGHLSMLLSADDEHTLYFYFLECYFGGNDLDDALDEFATYYFKTDKNNEN